MKSNIFDFDSMMTLDDVFRICEFVHFCKISNFIFTLLSLFHLFTHHGSTNSQKETWKIEYKSSTLQCRRHETRCQESQIGSKASKSRSCSIKFCDHNHRALRLHRWFPNIPKYDQIHRMLHHSINRPSKRDFAGKGVPRNDLISSSTTTTTTMPKRVHPLEQCDSSNPINIAIIIVMDNESNLHPLNLEALPISAIWRQRDRMEIRWHFGCFMAQIAISKEFGMTKTNIWFPR